jgi:probable rRNA maturation factor
MPKLLLRNRQRQQPLNLPLLRRVAASLAETALADRDYDLGFHLVDPGPMARLNQEHLGHQGPTDVITFPYSDPFNPAEPLAGEIFICVEEAMAQARQFRVTWQEEIVRYMAHGLLHLKGFDDLEPEKRRVMKKEENRLVRLLAQRFPLRELSRKFKVAP